MRSKEMTGRQQRGYSLAFGAQPMCIELAYDHSKTLPRFPRLLVFSLCIFDNLLVVSDGLSARWLATVVVAAAMSFPGVTGTWR